MTDPTVDKQQHLVNETAAVESSSGEGSPLKKPRVENEGSEEEANPNTDEQKQEEEESSGSSQEEEEDDVDEGSGGGNDDEEASDDDSDDDSDECSIEDEELSSMLWPTRDGVKHPDPQQQMQNLMQDMLAMRQENAQLLTEAVKNKRKASDL